MSNFLYRSTRVLVVLLLVLAGRTGLAQGTISGTVTGADGKQPLPQSRVVIVNSLLTATTDDQGKFTLRNVPPGSVAVMVMHVGYQSLRKTVTATAGSINAVDFQLSASIVQLQEPIPSAMPARSRSVS